MTTAYSVPSIRASGRSFSDLKGSGLVGHVEALMTANASATAAPTSAPTATATGGGSTGGNLAAGTYYITFTETNGLGETTASPESSQLTVSAGNIPRVTFPSLKTGNTARNVYLTAAGGGTGTEVLYASGITTSTYDLSAAAPASTTTPPATNSTALTQTQINRVRHEMTNPSGLFRRILQDLDNWLSGLPIATADINQILEDEGAALAILKTTVDEVGALVVANPGTLGTSIGNSGLLNTRRTWS